MNLKLRRYLDLEQAMEALDMAGNPEADAVRDIMDSHWHALSDGDRGWINSRVVPTLGASLRLSLGEQLFVDLPSEQSAPASWTFDEWSAA